uniref:DNA-(apurinic or apyrimidinic site) endonuclease 2 n=1 Tax=Venturia carpophila TaxID=86257 RepID=A0A6C0RKK3_9PEZI|nr:DNA lyase [Venturia carpophila]
MGLRITTWNVNGIRNPFGYQPWRENRTFTFMFDTLQADIIIMQELKIQRKDLTDEMVLIPGWDCYFSLPKHKKGYSGVGIFTRQSSCAPIKAEEGLLGILCPPDSTTPYREMSVDASIGGYPSLSQMGDLDVDLAALDAEGRCVVLEFPAFVLFGVYSPANSNGLRDDFRLAFLTALDARIRNLEKMGKQVILTGDLNVSRCELDCAGAEDDRKKAGLSHEQYVSTPNRRIFNQLLEGGEVIEPRDEGRERPVLWDTCRELHAQRKGMYTHWEQKINARPGNHGSRIDYVLCSISMKSWISDANIQEGLMGSDHCPVYAVIKDTVPWRDDTINIRDIMNPPLMFSNGHRMRDHSAKDLPPFSARLMPEFDKRRNIKDMFKRHASNGSQSLLPKPDPAVHDAQLASTIVHSPKKEPIQRWSSEDQNQAPNLAKRKASGTTITGPAIKKPKAPSTAPSSGLQKGQRTLQGFFQKKSQPLQPEVPHDTSPTQREMTTPKHPPSPLSQSPSVVTSQARAPSILSSPANLKTKNSTLPALQNDASELADAEDRLSITSSPRTDVHDPIVAKEEWTKLFTKKEPPRCEEHDEPCTLFQTKKKGFNNGRSFWICARPVGESGTKEKGTEWRCRTFIWASDWNGS